MAVHADGRATVFCGTQSTGQGHATSLAQIAASVLGIALDDIEVVEGDTRAVPFGTGTFNSRSMAIGGSAVYEAARKIIDKARKIAAYKLQRRTRDLIYERCLPRDATRRGKRSNRTFGQEACRKGDPHRLQAAQRLRASRHAA